MTEILSYVWSMFRKRRLHLDPGSVDLDHIVTPKRAKLQDGVGDDPAEGDRGEKEDQQSEEGGMRRSGDEPSEDGSHQLSLLECPVCVDTMESPVRQCVNGHCVCNSCRERVSACPICRGKLSPGTHRELDDLARNLTLPCLFREQGCQLRFKIPEREKHHLKCRHNIQACPLSPCGWRGPFCDLQSHTLGDHPHRVFRVALDKPLSFRFAVSNGDVQRALVVEDVVFHLDNETFVVEMDSETIPGCLAVVVRQMTACRSRLTPLYCAVTMSGDARGDVVSFRNRIALEDEDLLSLRESKRCFLVDMWMAEKIGLQGLNVEYTLSRGEQVPSTGGILTWLTGRLWQ